MEGFYSQIKKLLIISAYSLVLLLQINSLSAEHSLNLDSHTSNSVDNPQSKNSIDVFCIENNQVISYLSCEGLEKDACLLLANSDYTVDELKTAKIKCHLVKNKNIKINDDVLVTVIDQKDLGNIEVKIDFSSLTDEIKAIVQSSLHERLWEIENIMGDEPFKGMAFQGNSEVTSGESQSNNFRMEDFMMLMAFMNGDRQLLQNAAILKSLQSGDPSSFLFAMMASNMLNQNNFGNYPNSAYGANYYGGNTSASNYNFAISNHQGYSGPTYGVKGDFSHITANHLLPHLGPGLKPYAQDFVNVGVKYGLDPRFLAAISQHETGDGTSKALIQGNNAMGISKKHQPIYGFPSVGHSIEKQASFMAKPDGPYKDAYTIQQMASVYCPRHPNWPIGVSKFYQRMLANPNMMS